MTQKPERTLQRHGKTKVGRAYPKETTTDDFLLFAEELLVTTASRLIEFIELGEPKETAEKLIPEVLDSLEDAFLGSAQKLIVEELKGRSA